MDAFPDMLPEQRPAWQALRRMAAGVKKGAGLAPLVLHGPTGTGKTYLLNRLVDGLIAVSLKTVVTEAAAELGRELLLSPPERRAQVRETLESDLLIIEDLQHLPPAASDEIAYIVDHRQARRKANVFTANTGPLEWTVSPRLQSRLVGGLVVNIPPLSVESLKSAATVLCEQRQLSVEPAVLDWLVRHRGGLRPMIGDINRLEALAKTISGPLSLTVVLDALIEPVKDSGRLIDRLIARVEERFRVNRKQLLGSSRLKNIAWPRQVTMFMAREAGLSLQEIGTLLGNRDHTTVRHGVEKVRGTLETDPGLREWIRESVVLCLEN